MRDHDIDISPGIFLEHLQRINCDYLDSKMKIEPNVEKKHIQILIQWYRSAELVVA